jgi:hypothetical protein
MGWMTGIVVWFPAGIRDLRLLQSVQTGSGHPVSHSVGAWALSPGSEADLSPPYSAEAENE